MIIKEENIVDDTLISLYLKCFKNDILYNTISKEFVENDEIIEKAFNIYKEYGTIIKGLKDNNLISFLVVLHINRLYQDKDSMNFLFDQEKYPEIYTFLKNNGFDDDYILLIGVDEEYRNKGYATKLIDYYIDNYKIKDILISDVDNPFSYKIFKKLDFKEKKVSNNYYIVYK